MRRTVGSSTFTGAPRLRWRDGRDSNLRLAVSSQDRLIRQVVNGGKGSIPAHVGAHAYGRVGDTHSDLAVEVLLAILVTALAMLSAPRRQIRLNLASASLGRIQYGLVLGPSVLLAASLWLDIWSRVEGHPIGPLLTVIILAGCLWGLVLAATAALQSFGTRKTRS